MSPYLFALLVPFIGFYSLSSEGWQSFGLLIFAFGVVSIIDVVAGPKLQRRSREEVRQLSMEPGFSLLTHAMLPLQYWAVLLFLTGIAETDTVTRIGRILSMGVMCGVLGINVAHELGHKTGKWDQLTSQLLLLSSFYMHFFIEHNRGHHKNIGKPDDPGTAHYNESIFRFFTRALPMVYVNAWNLEKERLIRQGKSPWSVENQFLRFQIFQIGFALAVLFLFGFEVLLSYLIAAFIGILLLESINYIEHYGIVRERMDNGIFEMVKPEHSWNSDHWFSRMLLFELPLHPDHHMNGSRPYQSLNSSPTTPQMPFGYSIMIMMALVPPLWFKTMNSRLQAWQSNRDKVFSS